MRLLVLALWLASAALIACGARPPPPPVAVDVPPAQAWQAEPAPEPRSPPTKALAWRSFREIAAGSGERYHPLLVHDRIDLEELPAPFLARGKLFRAMYMATHHPVVFHAGELEGKSPRSIATPGELIAFAQEAGLMLDTEARRAAYVKFMLSLATSPYTFPIESVGDFPFTVERDPAREGELYEIIGEMLMEEGQKRRDVEDRLGPRIKPLRLTGSPPWTGVIHVLMQATLLELDVALEANGELSARDRVLAEGLPVTQVVRY